MSGSLKASLSYNSKSEPASATGDFVSKHLKPKTEKQTQPDPNKHTKFPVFMMIT